MTRLRLFLLGSTIVWGIAIAVMIKSSVDRLSVPPWGNPVGDDRSPAIADGTQVGQRFVAPYPGLYRIEVWLDPAAVSGPYPLAFHHRRTLVDTSALVGALILA